MNKQLLLKLHRWISLVFALPLLVIIVTGLILSFEPMAQVAAVKPQSVDPARVIALIKQHDPDGKARGLSIDASTQHLTLQGTPGAEVDITTGAAVEKPAMASVFLWARRTHEHLIGIPGLTLISTIAMVTIMIIGILMGLPRLRNTLSGWHKGAAWFTLPLILLSPLTGLCLELGLTFAGSAPPTAAKRISLTEAVSIVSRDHDLSAVNSIGNRGGRMMARIIEDDELRAYAVTSDGLSALPRNWPRLLHEGNWSLIGSAANVLISIALFALLITGVLIWAQRRLRRPNRARTVPAKPVVASSMAVLTSGDRPTEPARRCEPASNSVSRAASPKADPRRASSAADLFDHCDKNDVAARPLRKWKRRVVYSHLKNLMRPSGASELRRRAGRSCAHHRPVINVT